MAGKRQFTIFSTREGIDVIESPVKSIILSELRKGQRDFQEIVKLTGKSKSTVSKHLTDLRGAGLILERTDPRDRRKKVFKLNSRYLGKLTRKPPGDMDEEKTEFLAEHITSRGDPFEFFRLMFHVLRVELIKEGINLDPILHETGLRIGEVIYPMIEADEPGELLENLKRFWEINHLGRLEVEGTDPPVLRAYDCFECGLLPDIGESACALDSGIIEAVFRRYFNSDVIVDETECYARGDERCSFRIVRKD